MIKDSRDKDYWQFVWSKFKAGDRDSFEEIYTEFVDYLFAYGSKITSDRDLLKDCIQDLFMDLYKYSPSLKNPELLEFYLYKSLKRSLVKRLQKEQRLERFDQDCHYFDLVFSSESDDFQNDLKNEQLESLQKILRTLDDKKRELLFLKFNSGLNYSEIGELLDLKPDTVKKQVYRTIQFLRENYGPKMMELFFLCCRT